MSGAQERRRPRAGVLSLAESPAGGAGPLVAGLAVATIVLWVLWSALDVLLLAFAGVLLAVALRGLAGWVSAHSPLSPAWSLALVVAALAAAAAAGVFFLAAPVGDQVTQLAQRLPEAAARLRERVEQNELGRLLVSQLPRAREAFTDGGQALRAAGDVFSSTLAIVGNVAIVGFVALFVAASPALYARGAVRLLPHARRARAREVLETLGITLRWWLIGRAMAMVAIGVTTTIGLSLIGVPLALALGLVAAILNFVPNLGPVLAAVPAVLLALMHSPTQAAYVVLLYVCLQVLEGYVLTPLVDQRTVLTPPALGILAQVVLGVLAGVLGVVLATPLTATATVLVKMLYVEDVLGDPAQLPGD